VKGEIENGALVRRNEIGTRPLVAGDAPLDEGSFAAIDV
jgi:hypothetical protein